MSSLNSKTVRILLVEDVAADADLAKREISREIKACEFRCVETRERFLDEMAGFKPDLVVSDYSLLQFDGLSALRLAQEQAPLTPFIMLTGSMNEDTAVQCMKAGATNYVIKEHIKRLGQSVVRALEERQLRQERLDAEQALQRSERYFRSLIENAQDLITVIDAQGVTLFQSPSVERTLGYAPSQFVSRRVFDFIHPEDRVRTTESFLRVLADAPRATPLEFRIRHADGSWRMLDSVGKRFLTDGPPAVVVNSRDVTERHQLEEQLRQAQKMEAIGKLAGGVAHDFNNLLTIIMGNAALLRHDETLNPDHAAMASEIIEAAERACGLTRQLLLFSRKQALQLASLDLNDAVGQMLKLLQRLLGEDIAVSVECAADLPRIRGDVGMIDQVLLNLAVNARDAMPEGGRLDIRTSIPSTLSARRDADDHAVCLSVTDTGSGIAPEHLQHIFEPFFTTKEAGKGTGLGLATVYGIVKQHRGSIEVRSELGRGTTFHILFPAVEGSPDPTPEGSDRAALPPGRELVLVVEDELAVRLVVNNLLHRCGYQVILAQSGLDALEVWKQGKDSIRLLLTDIIMPDGMTGRELAARLRAESPDLRVIYSSGYSPDQIRQDALREPGVRFLQKPYSFAQLANTVRECLDEPVRG